MRTAAWFILSLLLVVPLQGRQLPLKTYTTADGLVRDQINNIVKDSPGFLWFCTPEGLSRFDGYTFTNYGPEQGMPARSVNDVLETRAGHYWVATNGGSCRFHPAASGPKKFTLYVLGTNETVNSVTTLLEDHTGTIWCGAYGGLYRLEPVGPAKDSPFRFIDLGIPRRGFPDTVVRALIEDRSGTIWAGAG